MFVDEITSIDEITKELSTMRVVTFEIGTKKFNAYFKVLGFGATRFERADPSVDVSEYKGVISGNNVTAAVRFENIGASFVYPFFLHASGRREAHKTVHTGTICVYGRTWGSR